MEPVFTYTKGMQRVDTSYCPGCTHGISHRIIMEVLEEKGKLGSTIGVCPIGCSVQAHKFMNIDMCESPHGRAPAVACGIKRVHPEKLVFSYQGDGDLASIGTAEIIHAAVRGEHISTFFINNAIYGMTGGQMAPTTLEGQRTTTTQDGRNLSVTGNPMHVSELMAAIKGAAYVERVSLHSPAAINAAKKAVARAFDVQEKGLGFSFVEMISSCPTNWGLNPQDSMTWMKDVMLPFYPLGVYRYPEKGGN